MLAERGYTTISGRLLTVVSLILTQVSIAGNKSIKRMLLTLERWWFAFRLPQLDSSGFIGLTANKNDQSRIIANWWPKKTSQRHYNTSKVALIIEPEPLPLLVPLILHMIAVVPSDWRFLFIGSEASVFTVGRGFGIQVQRGLGKIDLKVLPEPWAIRTDGDQARLLTDERFYDEFLPGVAWLLKYNRDSILCSNSETSLNEWLDVSWAGCARCRSRHRFIGTGVIILLTAARKQAGGSWVFWLRWLVASACIRH